MLPITNPHSPPPERTKKITSPQLTKLPLLHVHNYPLKLCKTDAEFNTKLCNINARFNKNYLRSTLKSTQNYVRSTHKNANLYNIGGEAVEIM